MTETSSSVAPGGGGEPTERRPGRLRLSLPGDWIAVDTDRLVTWKDRAGELAPGLAAAAALLDTCAAAFEAQPTLFSAVLAERGSATALATLACFFVGLPALHEQVDLVELVRANPPSDAVEGTFVVDEDAAAGGQLRARCLRRVVLEVPMRESVSLAVEYFVPIDEGMLVASFTTPNLAKEPEYLTLFSSIAGSIAVETVPG